jgi:hypothetical protein
MSDVGGLSKSGSKPLVIKVQLKASNNIPLKQGRFFWFGSVTSF